MSDFQYYKQRNNLIKKNILQVCQSKISYEQKKLFESEDIILMRFPLLVKDRDLIINKFQKESIEIGNWFRAPLSSKEIDHETFYYKKGTCEVSENICEKIINLPMLIDNNYYKLLKAI